MAEQVADRPHKPARKQGAKNNYPMHSPRFWHGMTLLSWLSLCAKHQCRFHPIRWPMAFLITCVTPFNSLFGAMQSFLYGKAIRQTKLEQPPVFIVGHWRSGTTLLHEYMALDKRFGSPTTYQCFSPLHFLLTEGLVTKYLGWLMPKQRPMDDMAAGWSRPQEDEFALLTMNAPTPYFRMAFPNDPPPYLEFLDMVDTKPHDLRRFREAFEYFVRVLTLKTGKRLLLKSPPHTGRIGHLAEWFPGAKFIHITRDPDAIFPSTVKLWESLDDVQGLQRPKYRGLEDYVFTAFERMYRGFDEQRKTIPAENIIDLKYEDLVADPVARIEQLYEKLKLGDFEQVRESLTTFAAGQKNYRTNKHELEPALRDEIRRRWAGYFERYGYE